MTVLIRALCVWVAILILAILNGSLREFVLIPALGTFPGMIISGLLLALVILLVAYLTLPWLGARRPNRLLAIGAGWLCLTLIFEFTFGFLQGKSLMTLLEAYTFEGGNLWPLVLLMTALSPLLAAKLRRWI